MTGLLLGLLLATGVTLAWPGTTALTRAVHPRELPRLVRGVRAGLVLAATAVIAGLAVFWLVGVPILALGAAAAAVYAPMVWRRRRRDAGRVERERAWPAALAQIADALEAGIAFPAAIALVAQSGPEPLRPELTVFHARLRAAGLEAALDGLTARGERSADTLVLLLRAGLLEFPAGGLAPVLRDLSTVLDERFEAREKARSRASSLQLEAAILALSPILLLLLVGLVSPAYLDAYRTLQGTLVGAAGAALIFGCYLLMRHLGQIPEPRRTHRRRSR